MKSVAGVAPFDAPARGGVDILIVAGEHSGDEHAARLVRRLLAMRPELRIAALGGSELAGSGAQMLYDMTNLGVVGAVEVLRHYGEFKALMGNVVDWVCTHKPRLVCFVDYPGFNMRVAERLFKLGASRKAGGPVALMHYVSPQIWAWKAGRRFGLARMLDALAVIFPFEVACYADTSLDVRFVGHPFAAEGFRSNLEFDAKGPVLLLPGSRVQPVSRIFPVILDAFGEFARSRPQEKAVVLYPDKPVLETLERILRSRSELAGRVELREAGRRAVGKACLMSSGTMSLSCALAGIPGAICYRAHPLTYLIGRMVVKVKYLGMANLLMPDAPPYPEFWQGKAVAGTLARELADAVDSPQRAENCAAAAGNLHRILSSERSTDMAAWMLELAGC